MVRVVFLSWLFLVASIWSCHVVVEGVGMADPIRYIDILNKHEWQEVVEADYYDQLNQKMVKDDDRKVEENFIEQRLDHFAPSPGHVLMQRYFYSDRYVDPSRQNQYAFICVGGEGPSMNKSVLVDSAHCSGDMLELAAKLYKEHGASIYLFGLEHRYYGKSYPSFSDENQDAVSPVTNENLVHLSSRQALADIAHFVSKMTVNDGGNGTIRRGNGSSSGSSRASVEAIIPASCKWVTFGGSYPGMLASWARLKFPHLIHAAVANSAPVQAEVDMASYNDWVAFDLQYSTVGGSKECLEIFREGHAQLVTALEQKDSSMLSKIGEQFNLCDSSDLLDVGNARLFVGDGVVELDIQSNDPSCQEDLCNIEKICSETIQRRSNNSSKKSWEILAELARETGSEECTTLNWNGTLDYIADPVRGMVGGLRSWMWQTCTEFGFYQTCKQGTNCPYGKGFHPLEHDFERCSKAFGIQKEEVQESVRQTLEYYGDKKLKGGSRILSVNGDVDPWSTLARTNDTTHDPLLPVYNVVGASHHFWTNPVKETDGPSEQKARDFIHQTMTEWLGLPQHSAGIDIDSTLQ